MRFKRSPEFIPTWFLWVGISIAGSTFGVILGELIGQWVAQTAAINLGHLTAIIVFEISIWLPRRMIFRALDFDPTWTTFTQRYWLVGEIFAWGFGIQSMRASPIPQLTAIAMFAPLLGAVIWFMIWFARQARPGDWWVPVATCYALIGLVIGTGITVPMAVLGSEVEELLSQMLPAILAHAGAGALIGLGIGILTGAPIARRATAMRDVY
jgi:hypothetical protein